MSVINYLSVTIFGTILMIWFCNIKIQLHTIVEFVGLGIIGGLINLFVGLKFGAQTIYLFYPLTIHLPLLVYCILRQKRSVWQSIFAMTMAYMLTTPRKGLYDFLAHFSGDSAIISAICDFGVTVLILAVAYHFLMPKINTVFGTEKHETKLLCIPPVVFYCCSYAISIYTDLIYYNMRLTIAVLTTGYALFFIIFELYYYSYVKKKSNAEQTEALLSLQLKSLQRLSEKITRETEKHCENELLNTVLSLYRCEGKAKGLNIIYSLNLTAVPLQCNYHATLLLAELLEDAVQWANEYISLTAVVRNGQLCIMLEDDAFAEHQKSTQEISQRFKQISAVNIDVQQIQLAINL